MEIEKIKEKILEVLTDRFVSSGGCNGVYIVEINKKVGSSLLDLTIGLNELKSENKIRRAEGSKGVLFLLNRNKIKPVLKPKK